MSKINIKIVEVDPATQSVMVKYTSDKSQKSIDEYPAVVFQVSNYPVKTLDEFIEAIRPQVSLYVWLRDQAENPAETVDISSWNGHSVSVDRFELPAPSAPPVEALANPEVIL
jgi:hypothetical protein